MICQSCKHDNIVTAKFCSQCGNLLNEHKSQERNAPNDNPVETCSRSDPEIRFSSNSSTLISKERAFLLAAILSGAAIAVTAYFLSHLLSVDDPVFGKVLYIISTCALLYITTLKLIFIYNMWQLLPSSEAKTTPTKAVLLLFVPLFNLGWIFRAISGFAKNYNHIITKENAKSDILPQRLFFGTSFLYFLTLLFILVPKLNISLFFISSVFFCLVIIRLGKVVGLNRSEQIMQDNRVQPTNLNGKRLMLFYLSLKSSKLRIASALFLLFIFVSLVITLIMPRSRFMNEFITQQREFVHGEEFTLDVLTENYGKAPGNYSVSLFIDNQKVENQVLRVEPGESRIVQFESIRNQEPGTYQISVGTGSWDRILASSIASIKILTPADLNIESLTLIPSGINYTEEALARVQIVNKGEAPGNLILNLSADGLESQTREVFLVGEGTEQVDFSISFEKPGSHKITVNDLSETLDVYKIEQPRNGSLILNIISGGRGHLKVTNNYHVDALFVLANPADPQKPLLAVYVHSENHVNVWGIKDGVYAATFSRGYNWDTYSKRFTDSVVYIRFNQYASFYTEPTATGYNYRTWDYELGVFDFDKTDSSEEVDPQEFPILE
jgi:hypothetical protein